MNAVMTSFFSYPVKTGIRIDSATAAPFPFITICNNNMVRKSALTSKPEWNETFWKYVRDDYKFKDKDVDQRRWRGYLREDLFKEKVCTSSSV